MTRNQKRSLHFQVLAEEWLTKSKCFIMNCSNALLHDLYAIKKPHTGQLVTEGATINSLSQSSAWITTILVNGDFPG